MNHKGFVFIGLALIAIVLVTSILNFNLVTENKSNEVESFLFDLPPIKEIRNKATEARSEFINEINEGG